MRYTDNISFPNGKLALYNNIWYYNNLVSLATSSSVQIIDNKSVIIGSYSGNNSSVYSVGYKSPSIQSINIGFKPSWIFVCATNTFPITVGYAETYFGCSNTTSSIASLQLADNGFNVYNVVSLDTSCRLNYNGITYSYICFR